MNLSGACCLVTGASGLLGSHLVPALLASGARVVALEKEADPLGLFEESRSRARVIPGEVTDAGLLAQTLDGFGVTHIFHLAAQTQVRAALEDPRTTFASNVQGTWEVLDAARRVGGVESIVFTSSDKAYGASESLPYREGMPLRGVHPYDCSKVCGEAIARTWAQVYGLPVVISRSGNLYGPGDLNFDRLVPGTLRDLHLGRRPQLRSDGSPRRDYVFVLDLVRGLLLLTGRARELAGEAVNFGSGQPTSVLELVELIRELAGAVDLPPEILGTARHELADQYLDSARAHGLLGWTATTPLREGLERTLPWYRSYFERAGGAAGQP